MECNLRALRLDAAIIHDHATKLRRQAGSWLARRAAGPRGREDDAHRLLRSGLPEDARPDLEEVVRTRLGRRNSDVATLLARCADAIEAASRTRLLVIDACEIDADDRIFLTSSLPSAVGEVRQGDELLSGAYFFGDLRTNQVLMGARFVRPATWSGIALPGRALRPDEDIVRVLRRSAVYRVRHVVETLRGATWIPAEHPVAALATLGVHVPSTARVALRAEYETGRERTLYGVIHALSTLACRAPDTETRLHLESCAGQAVLACAPLANPQTDLLRRTGFLRVGPGRLSRSRGADVPRGGSGASRPA